MKTIIAIDPGMMSGYFYGEFDELTPLTRLGYKQVPGGSKGFFNFMQGRRADIVVCEKFSPRPNGGRQYRLDELEPLRIEGWLEVLGGRAIIWQEPSAMVLRNGATTAERKANSDAILKENGWWLTGKDVDYKDANDVNAAAKHALAYMRSIGHEPTISTHISRSW